MSLLDPSTLFGVLPTLLPSPSNSDATASLPHPSHLLTLLLHTVLTQLDFRLVGLSDTDRLDPPPPTSPSSSSSSPSPSSPPPPPPPNRLPPTWSQYGPDTFSLRYKHHQSSLDYLLTLVRMGDRTVLNGLALQGSPTSTLTIPLSDYFSPSAFPLALPPALHPPDRTAAALRHAFTNENRCTDLVSLIKNSVVGPLVPGLMKEGFESRSSTDRDEPRASPSNVQARPYPAPPRPPFFSDPNDPSFPAPPFRNPLTVGDRDLDPLGGLAPSLPSPFGGGGGGGGMRGGFPPFPGSGPGGMGLPDTGGGMYVGPHHPMFRDRFTGGGAGAGAGAWGGGPVPPRARYDPIGPTGVGPGPDPGAPPPFAPRRSPDVGGPLARRERQGDPDWDDVRPPHHEGRSDYDNMFM